MNIKTFVFNPFYENTYVISSQAGNCLIFDPGCYEDFERKELIDFVELEGLKVKAIINTHCHIDHVLGNDYLRDKYSVPLKIPKYEKEVYEAIPVIAPQWGITGYHQAEVDEFLEEGNVISLDEIELDSSTRQNQCKTFVTGQIKGLFFSNLEIFSKLNQGRKKWID